jgi:tetratricopeptide (TPR) repeat protein
VIEAAAIEGREFHRGVVAALLADHPDVDVDAGMAELETRELVRPGPRVYAGDRGYRFTHLLVRDAAYELIPKRRRAELHVGFAAWLRTPAEEERELDEIIGYHLERAYAYRRELGRVDALPHRALAADASAFLSAAGRRVLRAGDRTAAANLLRRAVALCPAEDPERAALLIDLGGVLGEEGRFDEANAALAQAVRVAKACDDLALVARAQVEQMLARLQVDPEDVARRASRLGGRLSRTLTEADDHGGLARLWHLRGLLAWIRARAGDASESWRWAAEQASMAADDRTFADALGWEASAAVQGPTPVDEAFARCTEILGLLPTNPWAAALVQQQIAGLYGMRGEFDRAFALLDEANEALEGFSPTVDAAVSYPEVVVSMLASRPERAERHLRAGRRVLHAMGEKAVLASTEAMLGLALLAQGRVDEADRLARGSARLTTDDDLSAQMMWRRVRAVALAERGRPHEGQRLARDAVSLAEQTDYLNDHAGALEDLAYVCGAAGDSNGAQDAREAALDVYRRKGNAVSSVRLERAIAGVAP